MGVHPHQLEHYTPRELAGLLAYYQAKRDQMSEGG